MQKNNGLFGCGAMRVTAGLSHKRTPINILTHGDFHTGDLTGWNVTSNVGVVLIDQQVGGKVMNVVHLQNVATGSIEVVQAGGENLFANAGINIGDICGLGVSFWFKASNSSSIPLVNVYNVTPTQLSKQIPVEPGTDWKFCQILFKGLTVTNEQAKIRLSVFGAAATWYANIRLIRL